MNGNQFLRQSRNKSKRTSNIHRIIASGDVRATNKPVIPEGGLFSTGGSVVVVVVGWLEGPDGIIGGCVVVVVVVVVVVECP